MKGVVACVFFAGLSTAAVTADSKEAQTVMSAGQTAIPPEVLRSITALFDSVGSGDSAKFRDLLAPGFKIYEAGSVMSADQVFAAMRKVFDQGGRIEWSVTQPQGRVEGDLATVQYINRGAITHNGVRQPVVWLETASLVRLDGRWKILFMQSQRTKETATVGR